MTIEERIKRAKDVLDSLREINPRPVVIQAAVIVLYDELIADLEAQKADNGIGHRG